MPLSEELHQKLTPSEIQAYVLAQQMARLHAGAAGRWGGHRLDELRVNPSLAARNIRSYMNDTAHVLQPPSSASTDLLASATKRADGGRPLSASRAPLPSNTRMSSSAGSLRPHSAQSSASYDIITGAPLVVGHRS